MPDHVIVFVVVKHLVHKHLLMHWLNPVNLNGIGHDNAHVGVLLKPLIALEKKLNRY